MAGHMRVFDTNISATLGEGFALQGKCKLGFQFIDPVI